MFKLWSQEGECLSTTRLHRLVWIKPLVFVRNHTTSDHFLFQKKEKKSAEMADGL